MTRCHQQRITQHKRFVPYGTHSNSAFDGTSFMLLCYMKLPVEIYEEIKWWSGQNPAKLERKQHYL